MNFNLRAENEKDWIIQNTWCEICNLADLGLLEPLEYEEDGLTFIEGKCKKCGNLVISQIKTS